MLSPQEIEIVRLLQGDVPLTERPFADLADQLNMTEVELLEKIEKMQQWGIIRRFGAILRHRQAGMQANAMVVWIIPEAEVERVGKQLAAFPAVTHCYQRPTAPDWPYNLYTMVHARTQTECTALVQELAAVAGQAEHRLLYGLEEYKKTSMRYFAEEEEAQN
jgi:DNA-binding Lrp family transcriptional regulator